jgi:sugar phosphate isomerase/epimerase
MKLGFVSAILPELTLEEVFKVAHYEGYDCVEVMCWPKGKAERRYAGVTHIDVNRFTKKKAEEIQELCDQYAVDISGLGYYPNPLTPDAKEARTYSDHIKKVIQAAAMLGVNRMNTFVGRDWTKSVDDNWKNFLSTWKPVIKFAEKHKVFVGIENCPMSFTKDEWPGGKNLAVSPAIWRRMFQDIPSKYFGLNYDPSHMIWMHMDYLKPLTEFKDRISHVHAKDVRIDTERLNDVGILAHPNEYHTPKLPGMGDVDWGKFFSILTDTGYDESVCVEVEDRAFEGSLDSRIRSLRQSVNFLRQYIPEEV